MAEKTVRTLNATNAQILDAIRVDSSFQYQMRVPSATQGDISETIAALDSAKPLMNEFVDTLVNRIGDVYIKSRIWSNPLAEFKRGMLQWGESIEEVYVGLLEAHRYDPNKCYEDVFKCSKPDVYANFHHINRQDYYAVTINDKMLRRAFLNEYGLQTLVGEVLQSPYTSDEWDEYLIMRNLFTEYARNGWFYKVQVSDITGAATFEEQKEIAAEIVRKVRTYSGLLGFMHTEYNAAGVPTISKPNDLVLFVTPEINAYLDVNLLAFAFNVSAAEVQNRIFIVDDFGIQGAQAILADKDFFVCADTVINFESIRNPKQMSWNYFLNHHGIYSVSKFVNAILFTTNTGDAASVPAVKTTGVTVDYATPEGGAKPTFINKGEKLQLVATVAGSVTPETDGYEVPQGVAWSITATSGKPLSVKTFVDAEGWLHCAEDEENEYVTVTAVTAYVDPATDTATQTYASGSLNVGIGKVYSPGE